jgi:hypothetical protein
MRMSLEVRRAASLSRPDGRAYCLSALRALLPYEHSFVTLCIAIVPMLCSGTDRRVPTATPVMGACFSTANSRKILITAQRRESCPCADSFVQDFKSPAL